MCLKCIWGKGGSIFALATMSVTWVRLQKNRWWHDQANLWVVWSEGDSEAGHLHRETPLEVLLSVPALFVRVLPQRATRRQNETRIIKHSRISLLVIISSLPRSFETSLYPENFRELLKEMLSLAQCVEYNVDCCYLNDMTKESSEAVGCPFS